MMVGMSRGRAVAVGAGAGVSVMLAASIGWAAIPSAEGAFTGCYSTRDGSLRIIDLPAGQACGSKERQITWNEQGVAGPAGAPGKDGAPGPAGQPGEDGAVTLAAAASPADVSGIDAARNTGGAQQWVTVHSLPFTVERAGFYQIKKTSTQELDSAFAACRVGEEGEPFPASWFETSAIFDGDVYAPRGADVWLEAGAHTADLMVLPAGCDGDPAQPAELTIKDIHMAVYAYSVEGG